MRTYGALAHVDGAWEVGALEPHAIIKLKALFPQIPKAAAPPYRFQDTPERAADLAWFCQRYPLGASPDDLSALRRAADRHAEIQDAAAAIPQRRLPAAGLRRPSRGDVGAAVSGPGDRAAEPVGRPAGRGRGRPRQDLHHRRRLPLAGRASGRGRLPRPPAEAVVRGDRALHHPARPRGARNQALRHAGLRRAGVPLQPAGGMGGRAVVDRRRPGRLRRSAGSAPRIGDERNPIHKGVAAMRLAQHAGRRLGLSATPIYNYGSEIWNIMSFLRPELLDDYDDFRREWCSGKMVADPKALGTFLREQRAFLRRTKADVGQHMPPVNRIVDTIDHDAVELRSIDDLAHELAVRATVGDFTERGEATRMLDLRVRHATGVAKAKSVAAIARIMVEGGTPIVLVGWHRDVYDIWLRELDDLNPVLYTGSETAAGKNRAKDAFLAGETDVLIMSVRSGAGLDGLQARCSTMVFGELDWSPGVHHQCIGRLDREGQAEPVTAIFLVCDDGSDPPMMEVLGLKASQASALLDPHLGVQRTHSDGEGLKRLVTRYLDRRGAERAA
ncbi:MAG: SNF2-related protein [Caulobacteraceae bacterium]